MNYIASTPDFTFARKLSIKDIFNAKDIFASFSDLRFLTFTAFSNFIKANLFAPTAPTASTMQYYHIYLASRDELEALIEVIRATDLDKKIRVIVHHEASLIPDLQELITDQDIDFSAKPDVIQTLIDSHSEFPVQQRYWIEYVMSASNYADTYESLVKRWLQDPRFSLIDLTFDYVSFETAKFEELHALHFYLKLLFNWLTQSSGQIVSPALSSCCNTTGDKITVATLDSCSGSSCGSSTQPSVVNLTLKKRQNPLSCYVDENLDIRLDKDTVYFEMSKYLDKDGEDIPQTELNSIRKIIDIKFEDSLITNWYMVDLAQNFAIMGDHYQIPEITNIICSWLGQSIPVASLMQHVKTLGDIKQSLLI